MCLSTLIDVPIDQNYCESRVCDFAGCHKASIFEVLSCDSNFELDEN